MALSPGTRLGPYQIVGAIGAGGMGEVYRARDTKLNRDVAIKVIPDLFVADPERLARFEREAQALAALNHPHIAQIHGVIERPPALVMELVEGEDLALRLARGPLPIDEAIAIARQAAEAIEAAHERGIIHRDLKPANIKVTSDGTVKVLDFGLAKALDPAAQGATSIHEIVNSPTFTSPSPMTQVGVLIGTAAYMAPEQARGKAIDKRADVWAFGCVLYEMLTGQRPFDGDSVTDTLAAIVRGEPDWSALPKATPPLLRQLIVRCLEKDPKQRLRDIGEARVLLATPAAYQAPSTPPKAINQAWFSALAMVGVLTLASGYALARMRAPVPPHVPALNLTIPIDGTAARDFAARVSPDGQKIAYLTDDGLWVRRLAEPSPQKLFDDEMMAREVFWSPDSNWIGVATSNALLKVAVAGGAPTRIADISTVPGPFNSVAGGAAWFPDGRIVFTSGFSPLMEVPASGGDPKVWTPLASAREDFHGAGALPDGGVLTAIHAGDTVDSIAVMHGTSRTVVYQVAGQSFGPPIYSPTGHILFTRGAQDLSLWALPFDAASTKVTGEAFLVQDKSGRPSVSADGRLVIAASPVVTWTISVAEMDRGGRSTPFSAAAPGRLVFPSLSADGRRVVVTRGSDLWIHGPGSSDATQVTSGEDIFTGAWTPDGRRLLVVAGPMWCLSGDCFKVRVRGVDGGNDTAVAGGWMPDMSADGKLVTLTVRGQQNDWDVATVQVGSGAAPQVLKGGAGWQYASRFSPDTRYVAYVSTETGRDEVFVARYPGGGSWRVTTGGGFWPHWRGDGKVLFFARGSSIFEVPVHTNGTISFGAVTETLPAGSIAINGLGWPQGFDVSRDGKRFIVPRHVGARPSPRVQLLQDWVAAFK